MSLKEVLDVVATSVQIITFPIAAWSIYLAQTQAKASRDVQIALQVSESFRLRWESTWRKALHEILDFQKNSQGVELPAELNEQLLNMLNWVDWVGTLMRHRMLTNSGVLLGSIGPQFSSIIRAGRSVMESDSRQDGRLFWSGVLQVAEKMKVPLRVGVK